MSSLTRSLTLLALLLTAVAAAAVAHASTSATAPPAAMVRMAPNGDDGSCARGEGRFPCRSWRRAYAIAQAGDTISVAGGTYEGGTLTGSKKVTFRVAAGETARVDTKIAFTSAENLTLYGPLDTAPAYDKGEFYSMSVDGCSSNVELHDVSGRTFDVTDSARNVRIYGGDWGGYKDRPHSSDSVVGGNIQHPAGPSCGDGIVRDLVLDGVRFHDVQFVDESQWDGAHPDCLESHGAFVNMTIRNSTFERCGNTFFGIYTDWGSFSGLLMENNLFTKTTKDTFWGLQVGIKPGFTCSNIVFRYNTYDPDEPNAGNRHAPMLIDDCAGSPTQVYGNIIRRAPPGGGCNGAWSYNVFEEGSVCGTSSIVKDAFFVDRGSNYHLRPGSPAIGRGDPKRAPARDVDGQSRSGGGAADAGFDEAQPIVSTETKALMGRVADDLVHTVAESAALGGAVCQQRGLGNTGLQAAVNRLGESVSPVRGKSSDPCSFVASATTWGPYLTALRVQALASAAQDRRYQVVAEPKPRPTLALRGTTPQARAFASAYNAEAENAANLSELVRALVASVARADAAGNAGSASSQDKQLAAARTYAKQASAALTREVALRRSVAAALRRAGAGARLTAADAATAAQVARRGLPPGHRKALAAMGLRRGEISALEKSVKKVGPSELRGASLPGAVADSASLARLRSAATALRNFANA